MSRPITLNMRNRALAATVQAWVVAGTDARICSVQVMECCRKRRKVILGGLAVLTLHSTLERDLQWLIRYGIALIVLVGVGIRVLDQGHVGLMLPGWCCMVIARSYARYGSGTNALSGSTHDVALQPLQEPEQ
jgi:hypothetical protein